MNKCAWCRASPLEDHYHDHECGVPVHDGRLLFELLVLEGAPAGLSWATMLKKRGGYKKAFDDFDVARVATYDDAKINVLLTNPGIIRNRPKVRSAVSNARASIKTQQQTGSFDSYLWGFVEGRLLHNHWRHSQDVPATTPPTVSDTSN